MTHASVVMQGFLERHGPFTCLVDGANVAMYGQNWEDGSTGERGGFRFEQIEAVMEQAGRERPNLKPLLVLSLSLGPAGPSRDCSSLVAAQGRALPTTSGGPSLHRSSRLRGVAFSCTWKGQPSGSVFAGMRAGPACSVPRTATGNDGALPITGRKQPHPGASCRRCCTSRA